MEIKNEMKRRFTRGSFLAHCNGNPTKKIQENIATLKIVAIHLSLDLETKYNFLAIIPGIINPRKQKWHNRKPTDLHAIPNGHMPCWRPT
jgi:hypothetical protein